MKRQSGTVKSFGVAVLAAIMVLLNLGVQASASNVDPIRIVVLPFYSEEGVEVKEGGDATIHYRRMMRYINNQLQRHDFEVINPFATDAKMREYNRVGEIAREDSSLAALEVCKKYGVDVALVTWLKVKVQKTSDGYFKAKATLEAEGYDSAGRDLGIGIDRKFTKTKLDRDDAIEAVEIEVGDIVGRKLTAYSGNRRASAPSSGGTTVVSPEGTAVATGGATAGGAIKKSVEQNKSLLMIRLDGIREYEEAEVFGKVLKAVRGAEYAKMYGQRINPQNPSASFCTWRVAIKDTDGFVMQANIMKMIDDVIEEGGQTIKNGVPFRYTEAEIDTLKGIRGADATSMEIQFVMDMQRVRDRELSGQQEVYKKNNNFQ